MFQVARILAAVAVAALAACAAPSSLPSQGPIPPAVAPDKDCGSANHVVVTPCPVRLSKHTKSGVVVTVSGPHVVNSYLGNINSCFNGELCYNAERVGSSQTEWLITSGQACGSADVQFYGVDKKGNKIGYFFLRITNRYCP